MVAFSSGARLPRGVIGRAASTPSVSLAVSAADAQSHNGNAVTATSASVARYRAIDLHKSRLMRYRLASGEDWRCSVRPITDLTGRTELSGHVHLDLARSELDSLWNSDREQAVLETRFDPLGLELAA